MAIGYPFGLRSTRPGQTARSNAFGSCSRLRSWIARSSVR